MSTPSTTGLADLARRVDPDRFLTALFAPQDRREGVLALIAFNNELVRAVEMPSARSGAGPVASFIRLQWWREVVENTRSDWHGHPVADAVRMAIDAGGVQGSTLERIIAARETEADGLDSVEAWRTAMRDGNGGLQRAVAEQLGVPDALLPRIEAAGAAYGCGALRRHLGTALRTGRCPLPDEMLADAGTSRESLQHELRPELVDALSDALAQQGRVFGAEAGMIRLKREQIAAVLPLTLALRDLRQHQPSGARGFRDRLAVLAAYASGRAGAMR